MRAPGLLADRLVRRAVGAEAVAVRVEVGFPLRGQHLRNGLLNPGFTKCTQLQMEDFAVTCPLVPNASRLLSGFCSSPRRFGLGFLQTPPRNDALALLLAFGSADLAIGLSPMK